MLASGSVLRIPNPALGLALPGAGPGAVEPAVGGAGSLFGDGIEAGAETLPELRRAAFLSDGGRAPMGVDSWRVSGARAKF